MNTSFQLKTDRITLVMKTQGLKHWWVAESTGVHKTTLRRWLAGKITRVSEEKVRKLAEVLSVPSSEVAHDIS